MPRDPYAVVGLGVALLLVASPFWLLPHAGETAYTYEAERIEYDPGVDGGIGADGPIAGLDCYAREKAPGCLFAAYVAQRGPVTANVTGLYFEGYTPGSEYVVAQATDDPFRRRQVEFAGEQRLTYSLEAVGTETVLRDIAVNASETSPRVRRMIGGETVTVYADPLDETELRAEGQVVRSDGDYYAVRRVETTPPAWSETQAKLARSLLVLIGLAALRARWRRSDAER